MEIVQFGVGKQRYNKSAEQIVEEGGNENVNLGNGSTPQIKYEFGELGSKDRKMS